MPASVETNNILAKYHSRQGEEDVPFSETHDASKTTAPLYKRQKCLVGIKYVSYFNFHFFFQFLLMNKPHGNLKQLKHPNQDVLPENLQYFASCHV